MDWVGLASFGLTIAFFAGMWIMNQKATTKRIENNEAAYTKRFDKLETHCELQDKLIAETHTTSVVILTKLDYISESIAELREDHRISAYKECEEK